MIFLNDISEGRAFSISFKSPFQLIASYNFLSSLEFKIACKRSSEVLAPVIATGTIAVLFAGQYEC